MGKCLVGVESLFKVGLNKNLGGVENFCKV